MTPHKLPPAYELIGDRGYDSSYFRAELAAHGIATCIPSTRSRKVAVPYDTMLYRQRLAKRGVGKGNSPLVVPTDECNCLTTSDPEFSTQIAVALLVMKKGRTVLRELAK